MLYQVVHRKPMHTFKKVMVAIALLIVSLLCGLVGGQWNGKEAVLQNGALQQQLNTVQEQQQDLGRKLAAAELAAGAQVKGDLFYALIEMQLGAQVQGRLVHTEQPARSDSAVTKIVAEPAQTT